MNKLNQNTLRYKKLTENAYDLYKGSKDAAGFDLRSAYDYTIPPRSRELVKTDLQIEVPRGCYGRVAPRSGLSLKYGIDVGGGVIDADYRGNVGIIIVNIGCNFFNIKKGDRVAQLICEVIVYPTVEVVNNMTETERGSNGFGSSGMS